MASAVGEEDTGINARRWGLVPPTTCTVVGASLAFFGYWYGLRPLTDNSLFTHIATGRLIAEGRFPRADPYSFTAAGEPWVVQSWLVSAIYGYAESWWGAGAIRLVAGLVTGTLVWVVWTLTRPAGNLLPRVGITLVVMLVGLAAWQPRPALVALVLLGLTYLAAEGRLAAPWLVGVFWVWTNSHGSFPLGLLLLVCLAVGRRLDHGDPRTELRCLGWSLAGCLLGVVGPLGLDALRFPISALEHRESLRAIVEWKQASLDRWWVGVFAFQVLVAIAGLVRRPSYRDGVVLVAFAFLGWMALRNVAVASVVLVPGMARGLEGLGRGRGDRRSPATAMAGVVLLVVGVGSTVDHLGQRHFALDSDPVVAVAWLEQHGLVPSASVEVATPDRVGNFLELLYGDRARVFVDDRADMYPTEVFGDAVALLEGAPDWDDRLRRHGVDAVLWPRSKPLAGLLAASPEWRVVFQDQDWVIACPRTALNCDPGRQ
ncbi:MAG: hypothetical protein WHS89_02985 [Acidimicrobiales bacterium]